MGGDLCKETPIEESPTKIKNQRVAGKGGEMDLPSDCKVHVCVVAYDYHGYGANAQTHPRLAAVRDGVRFAKMAKDCGAEVNEFYDRKDLAKKELKGTHGFMSAGFPTKQGIIDEWRRVGKEMTVNDCFVFYFNGHGISRPREAEEGNEEMMVFMEPDGKPSHLTEDEVATIITESFAPSAHILLITDCFYNGSLCDLSRPTLAGRPIIHLAAVKDERHMPTAPKGKELMKDEGSAFTQGILETIENMMSGAGPQDFGVVEVYNKVLGAESQDAATADAGAEISPETAMAGSPSMREKQDFYFEQTSKFDPDTFRWPLIPPPGWHLFDPLSLDAKPGKGLGPFACVA